MSRINRREFLRNSFVGASGGLFTFPGLRSSYRQQESEQKPVIKRKLGRTDLVIPIVSFGVMKADNPGLIHAAMKGGITLFDTAHGYQGGKNEEMLGAELKGYPRDSFMLATKVVPDDRDNRTGVMGPGATKDAFLARFETSLKRLQMKYVDILYVHSMWTRDGILHPEMIAAVTEAKKSGKARYVGVSTHRNEPEVILAAAESGVYDVVLTAINYKQNHAEQIRKAIAKAIEAGVGIIAMKTMAGAFHDRERTKPVNCRAALKWVLENEQITTAIPGILTYEHLADNVQVLRDPGLTESERNDLATGKLEGSLYCNGCSHCVQTCKKNLPIPDMMRAYMYTYGYNNATDARTVLKDLQISEHPCGNCSGCSATCVKNFDVHQKISDIVRLTQTPDEFLSGNLIA
jgi:predicted aldo/keto reductase-like oxidoreductase